MKKVLTILGSIVAVLLCSEPVFAARIYNFLAVPIHVYGNGVEHVRIAPGDRSGSLSWGTSNLVHVLISDRQLDGCEFNFGMHAEITGGHYMIVSSQRTRITCTLCDSDHKVMARSGSVAPRETWDLLKAKPSTITGC